jgi:hypothetical protein
MKRELLLLQMLGESCRRASWAAVVGRQHSAAPSKSGPTMSRLSREAHLQGRGPSDSGPRRFAKRRKQRPMPASAPSIAE